MFASTPSAAVDADDVNDEVEDGHAKERLNACGCGRPALAALFGRSQSSGAYSWATRGLSRAIRFISAPYASHHARFCFLRRHTRLVAQHLAHFGAARGGVACVRHWS